MLAPERTLAAIEAQRVELTTGLAAQPIAIGVVDAALLLGISRSSLETRLLRPTEPDTEPAIASFLVGTRRLIWSEELVRYCRERTEAARHPPIAPSSPTVLALPDPLPQAVERVFGRSNKRPRLRIPAE